MLEINVKSLYKLTRQAQAKKDRERIGVTAKSEFDDILKLDMLKLKKSDLLFGKNVLKNRVCKEEAVSILNRAKGKEYTFNTEYLSQKVGEGLELVGLPTIKDGEALRIIKTPYSLNNFNFKEDDYDSKDHYYEAMGLAYLLYLNGSEQRTVAIDYVYVDTPEELWGEDDLNSVAMHKFPNFLPETRRVVTKLVSLTDDTIKEIEEGLEKCQSYLDEIK